MKVPPFSVFSLRLRWNALEGALLSVASFGVHQLFCKKGCCVIICRFCPLLHFPPHPLPVPFFPHISAEKNSSKKGKIRYDRGKSEQNSRKNIECLLLRQLADFLDILKQRLPRSDALLRYRFFYRGSNGCRLQAVRVSFCNTILLLIREFFPAPLANQKGAWYNMTGRTKLVIFKEARAWLLPITRLSSSARRC